MKTHNLKKLSMLLLGIILILTISFPALAAGTYPQDIRTEAQAESGDFSDKLVILHSNDVHGAVDGYSKMAALAKKYRDLGAEVILVDAGDFSQGDIFVNLSEGMEAVELMNLTGYAYSTMGNHEYDYEQEQLDKLKKAASFKILCADILKDGVSIYDPDDIYTAKNGVKVGFFGLDTPETQTKGDPNFTRGFEFCSGDKLAKCAEDEEKKLRKEGADLVIALTHLGVDDEASKGKNRSEDVWKAVPSIDFMIDGHSHTVMTEGSDHEPIQSTGTKFAYIGVVIIDKKAKITDHFLIDTTELASDPAVQADVDKLKAEVDSVYDTIVGESEVTLNGDRPTNRTSETNAGDFITDAMAEYAAQNSYLTGGFKGETVVIVNGGSIRVDIPAGKVTKKMIYNMCPFGNVLSFLTIKGSELLELLEASTFNAPEPVGGFPQTKGIEYTLDITKPYDAGELYPNSTYARPASINRVTIQSIGGEAFDPEKTYGLITTDFLASGGDVAGVLCGKDYTLGKAAIDQVMENYLTGKLNGKITKKMYGSPRGDLTIIGTKQGWKKEDGIWFYYTDKGEKKTGWIKDQGKWYYLGTDGAMKTGWVKVKNIWYYLKKSGAMASNEWVQGYWLGKNGSWTYEPRASWHRNKKGWWYGDTSGWYAKNGTQTIDGKKYLFNSAGYLAE